MMNSALEKWIPSSSISSETQSTMWATNESLTSTNSIWIAEVDGLDLAAFQTETLRISSDNQKFVKRIVAWKLFDEMSEEELIVLFNC